MEAIKAALDEQDEKVVIILPDEEGKDTNYDGLIPTGDQIAMFMAASATGETSDRVAGMLDLIEDTFGPELTATFKKRIRNRRDPLTFEGVSEAIVEAITDFPTRESSDSTSTPTRTGVRSTGRVRSSESSLSA